MLAKGHRVLVTSETPRALAVLSRMLPKEIRELCVMWLGSGPQAQKSLEESIHSITQRKVNWDFEDSAKEIQELQNRLKENRKNQAKLQHDLIACREADTYIHSDLFGEYSDTLEKIALRINKEREQFGWFLDKPNLDVEPWTTSQELSELLQFDRQITEDMACQTKMSHISINCLISSNEFKELVICEQNALAHQKKVERNRNYPGYKALQNLSPNDRARMLELLKRLISGMDKLSKHFYGWVDRATREIVADQDRVWRLLLKTTEGHLQNISDISQGISSLNIVGLEGLDFSEVAVQARNLKQHFDSGKGLGFLGLFKAKVVKQAWYLVKLVRVNGEPCRSGDTLQKLLDWLNIERQLSELRNLWKTYTKYIRINNYNNIL